MMRSSERLRSLIRFLAPELGGSWWSLRIDKARILLQNEPMLEFALEKFPVRVVLNDGTPCSIRPLETTDETAFRNFHLVIPEEHRLFIKQRIQDGSLFREWCSKPDFQKNLPLLAFIDGRLAALGTLHQRQGGWKRHIGKVSMLTHPDFRGLGLVDCLLDEIVEVAKHGGLTRLEAELNGEREVAIKAMAAVGFSELVRLPNYIQDMSGDYHDYVLLGMELLPSEETLGVGD